MASLPSETQQLAIRVAQEFVAVRDEMAALGSASTFAELTDAASADLPTVNTPLSSALAGKAATSHTHLSAAITDATSAPTANTLVRRDASGDASFGAVNTSGLTVTGGTTFGGASLIQFDAVEYYYGTGAASAHRTALGSGATGGELFTAASPKVANETLLRTTKIKTTQTDRTLSTAYTTDSDFTVPVTAGKTYRVEFLFITTATANNGWKGQFTIPSVPANITTTANSIGMGNSPGGGNVGSIAITTAGVIGNALLQRATATTNGTYSGFFEITIGTTGGNLLFQWGQVASHADNSSVLANSVVTVTERTP